MQCTSIPSIYPRKPFQNFSFTKQRSLQMIHFCILFLASFQQIACALSPTGTTEGTITYAVRDSIESKCSIQRNGDKDTSDFGCGNGLDCIAESRLVKGQCGPDAQVRALIESPNTCKQSGITAKADLIGALCIESRLSLCRSMHSTCDANKKTVDCCPGMLFIST